MKVKSSGTTHIVLVIDVCEFDTEIDMQRNDLELTDPDQLNRIRNSIMNLGLTSTWYESPKLFSEMLDKHKYDIVFSLWSGKASKNRRALVPAICEANDISYIGCDPYTALICQDKHLSKAYTKRFGLKTPHGIVFDGSISEALLDTLNFPVVVKPVFEGGSIGISSSSIRPCKKTAVQLASKLHKIFSQPIIIEEFIPGAEVSICILGTSSKIKFLEIIEVYKYGDEKYLHNKLFSFEEKKGKLYQDSRRYRKITSKFPKKTIEKAIELFFSLGKVNILRIDGRLSGDKFTVIELTPDVGMSPSGIYSAAFYSAGLSYQDMMERVFNVSNEDYEK